MDTTKNISLDFLSSQYARIIEELRGLKTVIDVDRMENRRRGDDLTQVLAATMGRFEASWQLGFEAIETRLERIEAMIEGLKK